MPLFVIISGKLQLSFIVFSYNLALLSYRPAVLFMLFGVSVLAKQMKYCFLTRLTLSRSRKTSHDSVPRLIGTIRMFKNVTFHSGIRLS